MSSMLQTEFVIDGQVVYDMAKTIGGMKLYIRRADHYGEEEVTLYFVNQDKKVVGKLFIAAESYGEGKAGISFI